MRQASARRAPRSGQERGSRSVENDGRPAVARAHEARRRRRSTAPRRTPAGRRPPSPRRRPGRRRARPTRARGSSASPARRTARGPAPPRPRGARARPGWARPGKSDAVCPSAPRPSRTRSSGSPRSSASYAAAASFAGRARSRSACTVGWTMIRSSSASRTSRWLESGSSAGNAAVVAEPEIDAAPIPVERWLRARTPCGESSRRPARSSRPPRRPRRGARPRRRPRRRRRGRRRARRHRAATAPRTAPSLIARPPTERGEQSGLRLVREILLANAADDRDRDAHLVEVVRAAVARASGGRRSAPDRPRSAHPRDSSSRARRPAMHVKPGSPRPRPRMRCQMLVMNGRLPDTSRGPAEPSRGRDGGGLSDWTR